MAMDCYDLNPNVLHPIAFFLSMLDGADDITEKGIDIYARASKVAKLSGLRDFDPWLVDATMDATTRALKQKQITDVLRMLGHLDGTLTTRAQEILVKSFWKKADPKTPNPFLFTLGELYMMREIQRADLATAAARALGRDSSHGFLYLAQVADIHPRVYDVVVIARRAGDDVDMTRIDLDPDIVLRGDSKWYLDLASTTDTESLLPQASKDIIQSIERVDHNLTFDAALDRVFHDILFSIPQSRPDLVEETKRLCLRAFDDETAGYLTFYGISGTDIGRYRNALVDRLELGHLITLTPDLAD